MHSNGDKPIEDSTQPGSTSDNSVQLPLIQSLSNAVEVVQNIIDEKISGFILISFKSFCRKWKERASVYADYEILCFENTNQSAGWAVCSFVRLGLCSVKEGTKKYQPSVGNAAFHRHHRAHNKENQDSEKKLTDPPDLKESVINAAAKTVAIDCLPLNFCDRKQGCLLYTSPSPRDLSTSRMPSSA